MSIFKFFRPSIKVVTHNGSFHADDVFACATLQLWAEKEGRRLKITRTRDPEITSKADIVLDTGNIYDPEKNRFDHHQPGGASVRENGIPYASFGLIWKHYGKEICDEETHKKVEENLVLPIDARDNGVNISKPNELGLTDYRVSDAIHTFNPSWLEEENQAFRQFKKALKFAKEVLGRELVWEKAAVEGARLTRGAIEAQNNPEILVLDKRVDSEKEVTKHKNIKFIASKSKANNNWSVISAKDDLEDYHSNRAVFPEKWRGLRDVELAEISGVSGAIFCHRGGWMVKAETKEAALEMARLALAKTG